MDKDISLFSDIRNRLGVEGEVSSKEYLYFLAVAYIPQLKYLQEVKGDCLADRKLLECKKSMQTASLEGYEQALEQFEQFKLKDEATLQEQIEKDYDNKMFSYNRDKASIEYQTRLFNDTRKNLENFKDYPDFYEQITKFLDEVDANIKKQKKGLKKPKKETTQEYKDRIVKAYEVGLEEYKKKLEEEKDYTIAGLNNFVKKFVEVLDACEESK